MNANEKTSRLNDLTQQGLPTGLIEECLSVEIPTRESLLQQGIPEKNIAFIINRATLDAQGINKVESRDNSELITFRTPELRSEYYANLNK
jgi:hypothetical protein